MPKNEVSDLITDQEIAFVHLIVSGNMTDQRAAAAVGLNPTTAAYIKSKPCVRAYMLEHRARMQQQLVEQETAPRFHLGREQVLDRLWELAILGPEVTRGSITGQVKAISMIVAIEGLIPDRRAGAAEKNPTAPPNKPQFYQSAWRRKQQAETNGPQPNPVHDEEQDEVGVLEAEPARSPILDPGESTFADGSSLTEQYPPYAAFPPDTRVPFSIPKNPFARRR
jgi:hypothetical protein